MFQILAIFLPLLLH